MVNTRWFKFGRRFTATQDNFFPDWLINWFIDKEEEEFDRGRDI